MTVPDTLDAVLRQDGGRCLAALIARTGDFALAEDCLQEAALSALTHWRRGVPDRPAAWLLRVASRKAIDRLRHGQRGQAVQATLERLAVAEAEEAEDIPDDRLRLIFTCCHPALEPKSQVALTLRTVCGLTTAEIARAFLDSEPTMGQRLSRAKATIAAARIPFAVPGRCRTSTSPATQTCAPVGGSSSRAATSAEGGRGHVPGIAVGSSQLCRLCGLGSCCDRGEPLMKMDFGAVMRTKIEHPHPSGKLPVWNRSRAGLANAPEFAYVRSAGVRPF